MAGIRKFIVVILLVMSACADSRGSLRPDNLGLAELEFHPVKPIEWKLDNGLTVLFIEDHELPKVSGGLYVRGGSLYETPDLVGLAEATGTQMREGGIPGFAPDALDERLDQLGASVESSFGTEFGTTAFYCLRENLPEVFRSFSLVTRSPQFDKGRLELWKQLAQEAIRRRRDNPNTMTEMAFLELVYGASSPYGRSPSLENISRISPAAMKAFHAKFFRPNDSILVIAGDTNESELRRLINEQFGTWERGPEIDLSYPPVTQTPKPGIYVLQRDFEQAVVMMGHLGPARLSPDMYELSIYNYLLGGGGFASELMQEVRTRLGLAYDVNGAISAGPVAGTFTEYAGTRVEKVADTIKAMIAVTKRSTEEMPDAEETRNAKSAVTRSFVFKFANSGATVNREALRRMLRYPDDFDQNYVARINAVEPEQVRDVGRTRVRLDDLVTVVVGKVSAKEIAEQVGTKYPVYALSFDTEAHVVGEVTPAATKE